MTIERKLLSTSPSGDAANVAEVFSTHLYVGTGSNQTINNGIDLSGEGGLVWCKQRDQARDNLLFDTERSAGNYLISNQSAAQVSKSDTLTSFNTNGFSVGSDSSGAMGINLNDDKQVSWTFRKKKKFFDVVTYTGNGATSRNISHSLGVAPAMMIVKRYDGGSTNWFTYHSGTGNNKYLYLNDARASAVDTEPWAATTPTDSVFTVGSGNTNGNTNSFVAYLFADNSSELADNQIIKCGSFTGNATVNLGWEPQFVLYKRTDSTSHWFMLDTMRGWEAYRTNHLMKPLRSNQSNTEYSTSNYHYPTSTGIQFGGLGGSDEYIYMAIRAPMMKEPEAATEVFKPLARTGTGGTASVTGAGFPFDAVISKPTSNAGKTAMFNRLSGPLNVLLPNTTDAETARAGSLTSFDQDGFSVGSDGENLVNTNNYTYIYHMFKRAKGFMDIVAFSGNGAGVRTINHSLSAVPKMMWLKRRNGNSPYGDWYVQHTGITAGQYIRLNNAGGPTGSPDAWNTTYAASDVFTVGPDNNVNNFTYIVYLFATLAGISKVGSYSGNAANNHVINCGFSAGARYVLIKRSDGAGDWFLFDSVRGITSTSNDGILHLNDTNIQRTEAYEIGADAIQPHASGFKLGSDNTINHGEMEYIFYAIA